VLIVCAYKVNALQIIKNLVFLHSNKWKGISHKTKFLKEYQDDDQLYNDFFRIGISFYGAKVKLYANFKNAQIIIGTIFIMN
jgi:hypothetical protein